MLTNRRECSVLHVKSKAFALRIMRLVRHMVQDSNMRSLHDQILRSGTSIHANVRESEFAQSSSDFISKLYIALKETNEILGWLELFHEDGCLDERGFESMKADCEELLSLLITSIKTKKANQLSFN